MRVALACLMFALAPMAVHARAACHKATIVEPQPFLGTAEEIIVLSDGTVWKDMSYMYLYLYAYYPMVVICADGRMILESGDEKHVFSLVRIR